MRTHYPCSEPNRTSKVLGIVVACLFLVAAGFSAEPTKSYAIAAGAASDTLKVFAEQSGRSVMFSSDKVRGIQTNEVKGDMTTDEAMDRLLAGTPLSAVPEKGSGGYAVRREATLELAEKNASSRPSSDRAADVTATPAIKLDTFEVFGRKTLNMDIQRTRDDVQPYVVFGADSIERSGATSLEDFFRTQLPMNAVLGGTNAQTAGSFLGATSDVNLRGLGSNQTLILVDGRRLPSINASIVGNSGFNQPDINGIPLSAIERIEVLPTTASGIYGGSATGGVINIILKRNYSSVEGRVSYENTFDTDVATRRAEFTAGLTLEDGRTHVLVSASWSDANDLLVRDRDFSRLARQGLWQRNPAAFLTATPIGTTTNIRNGASAVNGVLPNLVFKNGTSLGSPYTYVPVGYAGPTSDGGAALVANAGKVNIDIPNSLDAGGRTIMATPERTSMSLNVRRSFGSWFEGFVDLSRQQNNSRTYWSTTNAIISLPATAPNNPFNSALIVRFPTPGLGTPRDVDTETLRGVVGVLVRLPKDWMTEADYTWSRSRLSVVSTQPEVGDPDGAGPGISVTTAWTNGTLDVMRDVSAFPLNWGPYLLGSPDAFAGPYDTILETVTLRAGGPIVRLPSGPLKLSGSFERRDEDAKTGFNDTVDASAVKSSTAVAARSQSVRSYYLEARAPVFSNAAALGLKQSLEFQASVRRDDYETRAPAPRSATVASRSTPLPAFTYSSNEVRAMKGTFGFRYSPERDVVLRASVGTGFLPPSITQVAPNITTNTIPVVDPKRGRVSSSVPNVTTITGGNPDLVAEKSKSYSAGIVLTPRVLPGVRLSIDYTRIRKTDEIATMSIPSVLDLEDLLSGRVTRAPLTAADRALGYTGGVITAVDVTPVNLAKTDLTSWDLQFDYTWKHAWAGEFNLYSVATWEPRLVRQTLPTTASIDTIGFSDGPLAWRMNAGINWNRGPWTLGWNLQYFDSRRVYSSISTIAATTVLTVGYERYPSYVFHDLFARYRFGADQKGWVRFAANSELSVGIQNAFDRHPAIVGTTDPFGGFDPIVDPRLRRYSISLKKRL
jgi:iron complex outermembrane recepter protein